MRQTNWLQPHGTVIPSTAVSRNQYQFPDQDHAVDANKSAVSLSQVLAAGLASVGAATITSRFGVAGTLLGAALTTMIITGGSALIKSYLEKIGGRVRTMPVKIGKSAGRRTAGRADGPALYGRRRRFRRKSLLAAALVPAVIAFVLAMGAITGTEMLSGKTLSCMIYGECYTAASSAGGGSASTGARTSLGVALSPASSPEQQQVADPQQQVVEPQQQQEVPGVQQEPQPAAPSQDSGGLFRAEPQGEEPADPAAPAAPQVPEQQPAPVVPPATPVAPPPGEQQAPAEEQAPVPEQ